MIKVTMIEANKLDAHIEGMNKSMREWTADAARGECAWACSDCCCGDDKGMPEACFHGHEACTQIIQRDKHRAMSAGNEPS